VGGLYNVIFGQNPAAPALLILAGFRPPLPEFRFRDAWVERHGDEPLIHVYTRIGGGNRADHADAWEYVRKRPNYVRDEDDAFDSTYAGVWFRVDWSILEESDQIDAETLADIKATFISTAVDPIDTSALWRDGIESIRKATEP
jgi:hypothetical protein